MVQLRGAFRPGTHRNEYIVTLAQQLELFFVIGLGGLLGANLRYRVTDWVQRWAGEHLNPNFPWGTLVVNFTGSLLLALFIAWSADRLSIVTPRVRFFAATGFFGAYTTFSTFANESVGLLRGGDWLGGIANIVGTNVVCLVGVLIGLYIGSRL